MKRLTLVRHAQAESAIGEQSDFDRVLTRRGTEDAAEMARRRVEWEAAREAPAHTRGWSKLYVDTVLQADRGVDLDFLVGKTTAEVTRESH